MKSYEGYHYLHYLLFIQSLVFQFVSNNFDAKK
jgi:hypothetical protein